MSRDWESTFANRATPPGKTEQDRFENAVRTIRAALDSDDKLRPVTKVYLQGSYRNRVNVRQDSDIDLGILYTGSAFGVQYPTGMGDKDFGTVDGSYTFHQFKDEVGRALISYFGNAAINRGNKAFDVRANSYRVEADVVPTFVHRRYSKHGTYICGVQLNPDNGERIVNWPERLYDEEHWPKQHYEEGVHKNTATGRRYKGVVRILKKLRNEMEENGISEAALVSGFIIECMTWNVLNDRFGNTTWDRDIQRVLHFLWNNTRDDAACSDWGEVSDLKYLFRNSVTKREQAHAFINAAWDYVGVRI